MKTCARCKVDKPLSEFSISRKSTSGYYSYCKPCSNEKTKAYYHSLSKDKKDSYNHRNNLKKKFNLSTEEYLTLLQSQNNVCAICKKPEDGKRLAVDHDHLSGKVRGLLCGQCNTGLGKFYDNIESLSNAILYLKNA